VVPSSRLVTGVSSGTNGGSPLISRDSEYCGAVEGVVHISRRTSVWSSKYLLPVFIQGY
jgi:hypothetical protein